MIDTPSTPPPVSDPPGTGADAPASPSTHPELAGANPGTVGIGDPLLMLGIATAIHRVGTALQNSPDTYVPVHAMADVMAERWRQIHTFGHTPEADAAKSINAIHKAVRHYGKGLTEHVTAGGARSAMRTYAVHQAAALLAFIDRLDMEETNHAG